MGSTCCTNVPKENTVTEKFDPNEKQSMLKPYPKDGPNGTNHASNLIVSDSEEDHWSNKHHKNGDSSAKHYKILLLGPGMSGKTTIFKQMRKLHGQSYSKQNFLQCKPHLTSNLIEAFRKLCIYSEILPEQINDDTKVSEDIKHIRDKVACMKERTEFTQKILEWFKTLLKDSGFQRTIHHRYRFQLGDNFEYLCENMDKYANKDYIPTFQDYLHVKQRTVGIQKLSFKLVNKRDKKSMEYYDLHDAGGQRNERKKWMKVIRGVTAFIFVTAISGYNQSLWEQMSYNRMTEAIHLFKRVYHMEALSNAHAILFLNKYDLFKEKIKKYSIKGTFPEYEGEETAEKVGEYIVSKFREQAHPKYGLGDKNKRNIYFHFTCATDTKVINRVFEMVRDMLVTNSLFNIGFL